MLAQLDRVMRLLRRRPAGRPAVSRGAFRLLGIVQAMGTISTRELAIELDVRPSSLNEALTQLEQEQMLLRTRDPQDQRVFLVRLQPKGEERLKVMRAERDRLNGEITKILTGEETAALTLLTEKLADGLERLTTPPEYEGRHRHGGRQGWK